MVLALGMCCASWAQDTLEADTAFVFRNAQYDQGGRYYVMLTMARKGGAAHVQLHMLVTDTMAIGGDGNMLIGATYYDDARQAYDAVDGNFEISFLRYENDAAGEHAYYESTNTLLFANRAPLSCHFSGVVPFYSMLSNGTRVPYVPANEEETAIANAIAFAPVYKVVDNGQVLILRDGLRYSLTGARVE